MKYSRRELVRPRSLARGDLVGIVSPSWPGAARYPHRVERGVRFLESLGLRVRLGTNALLDSGYVAGPPRARADDLHEMFAAPEIKAIVTTIGGDHSSQLLPHLDFGLVRDNPKIFLGYSDTTVLHFAFLARAGLVTFYGPSLLTGLAEYPQVYEHTRRGLLRALFDHEPIGPLEPASEWTDELLDWGEKADLIRPRRMVPSLGWRCLRAGRATGPLVGGCLPSMLHLRGTEFWPHARGAILFWELSESSPPPERVDAELMDLELSGTLAEIAGMVVGRPCRYAPEQLAELDDVIVQRTAKFGFPVLADVEIGHTDPFTTVPLGVTTTMDAGALELRIDESACVA